jgi:hypothetical protein
MLLGEGRPAGLKFGKFPKVEVVNSSSRRTITVFGFVHGHNAEFLEYSKETRAAITKAINRFKKDDYILAEGYEDELLGKALEAKHGENYSFKPPADHIRDSLLSQHRRLRFAERWEWYSMFAWREEELILHHIKKTAASLTEMLEKLDTEESRGLLRVLFERTKFSKNEIDAMSRLDTETFVNLSGFDHSIVREIIEKDGKLRSLMAARTALWRAQAMDVKLFMGASHANEIVEFLIDSETARRYVEGLPGWLREIYDEHENCQDNIMSIYAGYKRKMLGGRFDALLMRWLAYKVYEAKFGLNSEVVLDFADYRETLLLAMRETGKNERCICSSSASFGLCCMPVMRLLEKKAVADL